MQGLHILLSNALLRDEPHAWLDNRDRDGLCIVSVVLVTPPKGLDVLRRDCPDIVAECLELPLSVERSGAGLDTDHAGRNL